MTRAEDRKSFDAETRMRLLETDIDNAEKDRNAMRRDIADDFKAVHDAIEKLGAQQAADMKAITAGQSRSQWLTIVTLMSVITAMLGAAFTTVIQ